MNTPLRKAAAILAALITMVGGITIALTAGPDEQPSVEIHTGRGFVVLADPPGPAAPVVADRDQQLEPDEQAEAARSAPDLAGNIDVHEDMRDETPPGVSYAELAAGAEETRELADQVLVQPVEPAGAQAYSCPDKLVRNRSALSGPRVGTMLHFTVSRPGSGNVIWGLFNTPSFGASSNKLLELDGTCSTLVPDNLKAWAQGAANSAYFSIEIVTNDLTREQWLAAPIIKRGILAALVRDLNRSVGAPLKLVDPVGCVWTPGVTDHDRAECGNTHWDVGKNFPWDDFMRQVQRGVRPTAVDRSTCRKLNWWRTHGRPAGKARRNAVRRRDALAARGVRCLAAGPVRV